MYMANAGPRLDRNTVDIVRRDIEHLLVRLPELDEDDVLRADMLQAETSAFELLEALEERRREAAALVTGLEQMQAKLAQRLARFERREQAMRDLMLRILQAADLRKLQLPTATLSVRAGPAKVIITDETALPPQVIRTKTEPDRTAIRTLLLGKLAVPGATLSNGEPYLQVSER